MCELRTDIDNAAVALPAHGRKHGAGAEEDALEINADHLVPHADAHGFERRDGDDAGVVHEDVRRAELTQDLVEGPRHRRLVADIGGDRKASPALGLDRRRRLGRLRAILVDDCDIGAFISIEPRYPLADACSSAGDDRDAIY
jgi:hypothetical protein